MADGISQCLIDAVKNGTVTDRDGLQRLKLKLCGKFKLMEVPPNSEILAQVSPEDRILMEPFLIKKPMRTSSGVAVVAVMTSPHPCPHGRCIYCPGGVDNNSPQSYTGKEPAARRAARNHFDPYDQVSDRLRQLKEIGHRIGKVELIIMGGTFTSRDIQYQEWFVQRCYDAMNGSASASVKDAMEANVHAPSRCVGLTVETRPDMLLEDEQADRLIAMGVTRVELGVQILDDCILEGVDRGHGTAETRRATALCRGRGMTVCYHIMPGLPGSNPGHDIECFRTVYGDPAYRPDMLKFYPVLVIAGTKLYEMWKRGEYTPLDADTAVHLLSVMKAEVPEYMRIQRIQRDIPVPEISAGILKSNLRQLVHVYMEENGLECRCIRCREVGRTGLPPKYTLSAEIKITEYEAAEGVEKFISLETEDCIIGYVRLRIGADGTAILRDLKVSGRAEDPGDSDAGWQNRGYGGQLLKKAESMAADCKSECIRAIAVPGAVQYYTDRGYVREGSYMVKHHIFDSVCTFNRV